MIKFFSKANKNQKGFTLIELLIVIVILGVLAAAIIPNLSKFVSSGQVGAANAELASVRTAVSAFIADHQGALPTSPITASPNADLDPYVTGGIKGTYTVNASGVVTGTAPPYTGLVWTVDKWAKP